MKPLVSVVIPFKDRFHLLRETLASVSQQTYRDLEVILINDGSTSSADPIIDQSLDSRIPRKIITNEKNLGPGASRQKGLENSSGDFVLYLDSDDILHAKMVEKCMEVMIAENEVGMCYVFSADFFDIQDIASPGNLKPKKRRQQGVVDNVILNMLYRGREWDSSACLWRKTAIAKFSPWLNQFHFEDYAYAAQLETHNVRIKCIREILCYYRDPQAGLGLSHQFSSDDYSQRIGLWINVSNYILESSLFFIRKQWLLLHLRIKIYKLLVRFKKFSGTMPNGVCDPVIRLMLRLMVPTAELLKK